jgi:hypothetical protein
MLAALPMGANRDWAWAPIAVALGLLAVLMALGLGAGRGFAVGERERWPLLALIACFGLFVAFVPLQGSSIAPGSQHRLISRRRIRSALRCPTSPSTRRETVDVCIACGLIFVMARAICKDRDARTLLVLLVASAAWS